MKKSNHFLLCLVVCALAMIRLSAAEFIIPHYIVGNVGLDYYDFELVVANESETGITVSIRSFHADGSPGNYSVSDAPVPAKGLLEIYGAAGQFEAGWLKITTSGPASVRGESGLRWMDFSTSPPPPCGYLPRASRNMDPVTSFLTASLPVSFNGSCGSTGIALTFPSAGSEPVSVHLKLADSSGALLGETDLEIPPNGQRVFLIEEAFPQLLEHDQWAPRRLTVSSPVPVFGTALRFRTLYSGTGYTVSYWQTIDFK